MSRRMLHFTQYTTASGILAGGMRRKHFRSCDVCGAAVHLDDLVTHARFHAKRDDLDGYCINPSRTENLGDRTVSFDDDLAEVRPS